jgi:DNA-binding NarL/FixJ family response regulator
MKGETPGGDRGTVLVAEDHAPLRTSLVTALRRAGFTAEGADTGQSAAARLLSRAFEVLLADINMPGNAQLELLSQAKALGVGVLLMTGEPSVDTAIGALQGGAIDYLKKPIAPELLLQRLDAAVTKARAARVAGTLSGLPPDEQERLSLREREVVALLACGTPPKEIATRLGLSANTVRNHIKSIFAKLRVHSQVELLLKLRGGER